MRQRKKIKYVQKQPPDKNNSKTQNQTQTNNISRQNQQEYRRQEKYQHVDTRQNYSKTYLINKKQHNQSYQPNTNKRHYQNEEKRHFNNPKYTKKQYEQPNKERNYNKQVRQKQYVPKYIMKQSSQCDQTCIICSQQIRRKDYIWTCTCCCISMHLKCIKEWIKNINLQKDKQSQHIFNWKCPQCNYEYNQPMPKYYCYCGKHMNPQYDRDLQAHSCGQLCKRKRGTYCPHPCQSICHSGKCKPCEYEGIIVRCQCGKNQRSIKCSEERAAYQCGKKCQKILNCHKHKCQKNCHIGPCQPCKKKKMVNCYCGSSQDIIDCEAASFSCGNLCNKLLDCGFHKCQSKCHTGACNTCTKIPALQKTCPCGKYEIQLLTGDPEFRKSCEQSIPVCGMPCDKVLDCGHLCSKSCHQGPCSQCKKIVDQLCVCGMQSRKIQCFKKSHQQFRCELACKKKRSCGIHTCNQICCRFRTSVYPADHLCQLNCTKMLNCQKHECGQPCHIGLCKKCPVIYSQPQPCPCGRTFMKPPIICGVLTPQCDNICNKQLQCGHKCQNVCHYGKCKCSQQVKVICRCGRQAIPTICGRQTLCLNKCSQTLPCGHKCNLQCHKGTCEQAHKSAPCKKQCGKTREDCYHVCQQACHKETDCVQYPCEAEILVKCDCGHRQSMSFCGAKDNHLIKKTIVCNKKCQNLKRFDVLYKNKQIYYPQNMVRFAFKNYPFLQNLQNRLQKFILYSQQNFIQVQFKFQDNQSKILLTSLFQSHYHLNTHFIRHGKYAAFTLMQTQHTMIPKPILSEYAKQISKGVIKQSNLPFQFTISFQCEQRDKSEVVIKCLKQFLHQYYSERHNKMVSLHFWNRSDGQRALNILQDEFQTIQFRCSQNIVKQQEQIDQGQIVERQMKEEQIQKPINKKQLHSLQQNKGQNIEGKKASQQIKVQQSTNTQTKTIPKKAEQTTDNKQRPPLIVRKGISMFKKNTYPQAKQNIQDIYLIDQDQLYNQKIDWQQFVQKICNKKMGPQATQWRIRALLIISSFFQIKQSVFYSQFENIIEMYNKDKQSAMKILQIQRIQNKQVKEQMNQNGIYLSNHQPQILGYLMLYNYLAGQKIKIQYPGIILQTQQYTKIQEILKAFQEKNTKLFYQHFKNSDYVYACALIPFVDILRSQILQQICKGARILAKDLHKYLLFDSYQQFIEYAKQNGVKIQSRLSKSIKQNIYVQKEGTQSKQPKHNHKFIDTYVFTKRDKKYFFVEPQQLYKQQYFTRSFFCFGDFKESMSQKYIMALIKLLKQRQ